MNNIYSLNRARNDSEFQNVLEGGSDNDSAEDDSETEELNNNVQIGILNLKRDFGFLVEGTLNGFISSFNDAYLKLKSKYKEARSEIERLKNENKSLHLELKKLEDELITLKLQLEEEAHN